MSSRLKECGQNGELLYTRPLYWRWIEKLGFDRLQQGRDVALLCDCIEVVVVVVVVVLRVLSQGRMPVS